MSFVMDYFGTLKTGEDVHKYTLTNQNGVSATFIDLGAVWVAMEVPDRKGNMADVVLGYDTLEDYLLNPPHFGAPIGRNANRIGGAAFTLNGTQYQLTANNGPNNLHSGPDLYHSRIWDAEVEETGLGSRITFFLESPDKDQGYPGNASIRVRYTLTGDDSLMIEYQMTSDADTIANLTNHAYFNLAGHDAGTILDQQVWINADFFTPADEQSIPTGEIRNVKGTAMDFTAMKPIGQDIDSDYEAVRFGNGFDHNWVLKTPAGESELCAKAWDPKSGRAMEVYTDLPGMQFYTGNFLNEDLPGKGGAAYPRRSGYCFETQYYPNAINMPDFPSPVLKAGETFQSTTTYKFMAE